MFGFRKEKAVDAYTAMQSVKQSHEIDELRKLLNKAEHTIKTYKREVKHISKRLDEGTKSLRDAADNLISQQHKIDYLINEGVVARAQFLVITTTLNRTVDIIATLESR